MESDYSNLLRDAMDAAGTSRTRLAKDLAARTGNLVRSEYRSLGKYLGGEEPTRERAALLAALLNDPRLAQVKEMAARQSARRAELEARVAELEKALNLLGPDLRALAALPGRVTALEQLGPPKKGRADREVAGQ